MDGKESSSGKKPRAAPAAARMEAERRGDGNRGQEGELAAALREAGRRVAMATRSTKATMATVHPPCRDGNDEIDGDEGNESWRGGRRGQREGSRMPLWRPISTLEGRRRPARRPAEGRGNRGKHVGLRFSTEIYGKPVFHKYLQEACPPKMTCNGATKVRSAIWEGSPRNMTSHRVLTRSVRERIP